MRSAREKLTSSTGLERTYEYELVRLFAQYNSGISLLQFVLAAAIAAVGALWIPIPLAVGWTCLTAAVLGLMFGLARSFLAENPEQVSLSHWRRRFALAQLIVGLDWGLSIQALTQMPPGASAFLSFVVLMVTAVTATLSATIPLAVYLGLAPLGGVVLAYSLRVRGFDSVMLLSMAASAIVFFLILANRLYCSAVATITSRAEKDAIFAELEQAKANSTRPAAAPRRRTSRSRAFSPP